MIALILGASLTLALIILVFTWVYFYRALVKLDNYSNVVGNIAVDILKFNEFVSDVNEEQLFFEAPKLREMYAAWQFLEHTLLISVESLNIIVEGGNIIATVRSEDGEA